MINTFPQELIDRFNSSLKADDNGCLLWQKTKNIDGYGLICLNRKKIKAHRMAWALKNGPIPDGMFICHRCDVRECCNPDHLFLGTNADNMADCSAKGRSPSGALHWSRACPELVARGARHGWQLHPELRPCGEKNGGARLTASQVSEIRALRGKLLQRVIAARFGIARSAISKIQNNKSWRAPMIKN